MFTHKFIDQCIASNTKLHMIELPPEPKYYTYTSSFTFLLEKLSNCGVIEQINISNNDAVSKRRFEMAQEFMEYYNEFAYHREMKPWLSERGMKTRMKEVIGDLSSTHVSQYLSIRSFEFLCKWYSITICYGKCVFNKTDKKRIYYIQFIEENETVREIDNSKTPFNQLVEVHSLVSPLRGMSSYKKPELVSIANTILERKTDVELKSICKNDLYTQLFNHMFIFSKIDY